MNIIKYFNHGVRHKCYIEIDDKKISSELFFLLRNIVSTSKINNIILIKDNILE